MRVSYDVKVPMRDGIRLSADLYLPDAEGTYPVILHRTPYNNNHPGIAHEADLFAAHGYAYAAQDCRGKYESEGIWYPYRHEAADGDDSLTWCGTQPWSNGRVGMLGGSYSGTLQFYAAATGNPYLKCILPMVAGSDLFFDNGLRRDGVLQVFFIHWAAAMAGRTFFAFGKAREEAAVWQTPLSGLAAYLGLDHLPYWEDFVRHDAYDDFWLALSIRERYGDIDVPSLSIGGWHSPWELQGVLTNFMGLAAGARSVAARRSQKLVIGPWTHQLNESSSVGELDFGPGALIDLEALELRWFDRWLREEMNGIDDEPPVHIFVTGANAWREEPRWPLERARPAPYYLHSGGRANSLHGDGLLSPDVPIGPEPVDQFTYNPERPVPAELDGKGVEEGLWADRRPIERRDDVLVYTTEPLAADTEITGPINVTLFAGTSAPDTDFVAVLLDVHPDGLAQPIAIGIARGLYLSGYVSPRRLEPGRVYAWHIDLWAASHVFLVGHRIRVDLSSSFFPFFGRNHNTGHAIADDVDFQLAEQTVLHAPEAPSHIMLPIVPTPETSGVP